MKFQNFVCNLITSKQTNLLTHRHLSDQMSHSARWGGATKKGEKEKRNTNIFINLFMKTMLYSAKNVLVYVLEDVY